MKQSRIDYIEAFPRMPSPYSLMDWRTRAADYINTLFDKTLTGEYLPLLTFKDYGAKQPVFVLPSYIGTDMANGKRAYGEALTCLGGVLGGLAAGFDMKNHNGFDFVAACEAYRADFSAFEEAHGIDVATAKEARRASFIAACEAHHADFAAACKAHPIDFNEAKPVLNNVSAGDNCGSFWYDIFPSCLYFHIGAYYPGDPEVDKVMRGIADSWLSALPVLLGNWDHTGFSQRRNTPMDSGHWIEPDAAIGIAYLLYMAYARWGGETYKTAALTCMREMQHYDENVYYEILGSYGPVLAAKMNVECNAELSVGRFLQFVFDETSAARPGWGVINKRFGEYDAYGLSGSTTDTDGYAFSMNTYVNAALVAPVARYAPEYARAIGRYLLHVAVSSRLFYPDAAEDGLQNAYDLAWADKTGINCISYEGMRNKGDTIPYSTGDAHPPRCNFNPYGAWGVGLMSALFTPTDMEGIIATDLLSTDFGHGEAYPTGLLYNPHDSQHSVTMSIGAEPTDIYDAVSKQVIVKNAVHTVKIILAADSACVWVCIPAGTPLTEQAGRLYANGICIDPQYDTALYQGDVPEAAPHLAFRKQGQVSSQAAPGFGAEAALDGDWRSVWTPMQEDAAPSLTVDLGAVYTLSKIILRWEDNANAQGYTLQAAGKDGQFTAAFHTQANGRGGLEIIKPQNPVTAQYIRLNCTPQGNRIGLIELEVFGNV